MPCRLEAGQALPPGREASLNPPGAAPLLTFDGSPPEQATAGAELVGEELSCRFLVTYEP
jgi:hypothetical protein